MRSVSHLGEAVPGFGQDANGEVYVMVDETGTPLEDTGMVGELCVSNSGVG